MKSPKLKIENISVCIVDYGQGNLGSIQNMLHFLGHDSHITSEPSEIERAKKLILPGVGSFDTGMRELEHRGLIPSLHRRVIEDKIPVLGICLGAQLMTRGSEEGNLPGLGWFDAETVRFRFDGTVPRLPIPNIGWRGVCAHGHNNLMRGWQGDMKFYFVHSYYIKSERKEDISFTSDYGHKFAAGLMRENIFSTQFHPEKSHKYGMHIMSSFANV